MSDLHRLSPYPDCPLPLTTLVVLGRPVLGLAVACREIHCQTSYVIVPVALARLKYTQRPDLKPHVLKLARTHPPPTRHYKADFGASRNVVQEGRLGLRHEALDLWR